MSPRLCKISPRFRQILTRFRQILTKFRRSERLTQHNATTCAHTTGREAWTVVPMPRTRCGEARHREAGADGAEERETEAREGQGMLMREAEEREAEERVEQRILLPFLFVRSESMPRFTTSCLRTSYSCDI